VLGLLIALGLGVILFGRLPFRVEAPFILQTDEVMHVVSPFDGYIEDVFVRLGDDVAAGGPLLALDTRDLLLEETSAMADEQRYQREEEKARAEEALAEMRIASALVEQARARLAMVRHHLSQAQLNSPLDGVVVQGDLLERVGSPVAKGEPMFRVVSLGEVYIRATVDESDVHEVTQGASGQIAFASQPGKKFPVVVERVDPSAQPGQDGNMFLMKCAFAGTPPDWWRPGMSGVCKVNAGKRSLLWIFTHKTVDFLRLKLWW